MGIFFWKFSKPPPDPALKTLRSFPKITKTIFSSYSSQVSELWYKEILNYDFDSPGFSNDTLDFSQLVWLSSRKLGVGKATGAEGVTVVVARYEPVGNIDGLFVQNVKRRGHERGSCEPMIFHVEYRYRVRTDSKSTNSFLSWENEGGSTIFLI